MEEVNAHSISLYPNPADEVVFVRSSYPISKLILYDAQMRLLKVEGRVASLDVSSLKKGIYFLKIEINGNSFMKKVFVKGTSLK